VGTERWTSEEGSAPVEFVFVGILLTFLTLGVLQLALTLHVRNTIQDAAAEGARWASLADSSPEEGIQRTADLIAAALGPRFADDIRTSHDEWLGASTTVITVRTALPLVGLWGPSQALEVSGHAATEVFR
jgi:Flp pilus assembly protein TadG